MTDRVEIERVTGRIRLVELGKSLADKGKYDEALEVLQQVRDRYDADRMRRHVDRLIQDIEQRRSEGEDAAEPDPA